MNELKWVGQGDQEKELNKHIKERKENQSKDGYIVAAKGEFEYKKVRYLIKVLRYFNHTRGFCSISNDRISDKHVVVECPEENIKLVELVNKVDKWLGEFLYHDTLHSWCDNMTVEDQIKVGHKMAREDIDGLSTDLVQQIDEQIIELKGIKKELGDKWS